MGVPEMKKLVVGDQLSEPDVVIQVVQPHLRLLNVARIQPFVNHFQVVRDEFLVDD